MPVIESLAMQPHPEGGYYVETWKAAQTVTLPDGRVRPLATLINFYLPAGTASAWHVVRSDEIWIANAGRVTLELGGSGEPPGTIESFVVGTDLAAGERPQVIVPAAVWQRTLPAEGNALVSCLVSPGFDFDDFALEP